MNSYTIAYWIALLIACLLIVRTLVFVRRQLQKDDVKVDNNYSASQKIVSICKLAFDLPELFDSTIFLILFLVIGLFGNAIFQNSSVWGAIGFSIILYAVVWIYFLAPVRMKRLKKIDPLSFEERQNQYHILNQLKTNAGTIVLIIAVVFYAATKIMHF